MAFPKNLAIKFLMFFLGSTVNARTETTCRERALSLKNASIDQEAVRKRDTNRPFFFTLLQPDLSQSSIDGRFTADIGTKFQVEVNKSATIPSLTISIEGQPYANAKDKIFLDVFKVHDQEAILVDDSSLIRTINFDMMFDQSYQTADKWVMHLQVVQRSHRSPPLTLNVKKQNTFDAAIVLELGLRDDQNYMTKGHPETMVYTGIAERGQWRAYQLRLKPAPLGSTWVGLVEMMIDGKIVASYHGPWGYQMKQAQDDFVGREMGVDLGTYRLRQETTQTIHIRNIHYSCQIED